MPVTGSSLAFNWPMVHDGVIRRSEEELSDVIWRGMSPAACIVVLIVETRDVDLIGNGRRTVVVLRTFWGCGLTRQSCLEFGSG